MILIYMQKREHQILNLPFFMFHYFLTKYPLSSNEMGPSKWETDESKVAFRNVTNHFACRSYHGSNSYRQYKFPYKFFYSDHRKRKTIFDKNHYICLALKILAECIGTLLSSFYLQMKFIFLFEN